MKNIIPLLLLCFAAALDSSAQTPGIVTGNQVCIRRAPNESTILKGDKPHLFTGEIYDCVGETEDYYHIVYNGSYYYLPKKYGRPRY